MLSYIEVKDEIKQYNRFTSVEFIIGTKCQNACKYCYRVPYQNLGSYIDMSIENMKLYYNNAVEMGLISNNNLQLELFGGEPIIDLDYFKNALIEFKDKFNNIIIPTNGRILENLTDYEIEDLINASDNKMHISLSVDGPLMENIQRPLSNFGKMQGFKQNRNWDRLIYLSKKYDWGFHPMFWLEYADAWFDTFKWFIDNDVHPYLLEVRHGHYDDSKLIEGVYQLAKIIEYCIKYNIDIKKLNTTKLGIVHRGLTCSALTTLCINTDGCVYFCHRLLKPQFKIADLKTKEININNYIALGAGFDFRNFTSCISCPIRQYCCGPCIGMLDEYWDKRGAISIPIPSMCKYNLLKIGYFSYRKYKTWDFITDTNKIHTAVFANFGHDIYHKLDKRLDNDEYL